MSIDRGLLIVLASATFTSDAHLNGRIQQRAARGREATKRERIFRRGRWRSRKKKARCLFRRVEKKGRNKGTAQRGAAGYDRWHVAAGQRTSKVELEGSVRARTERGRDRQRASERVRGDRRAGRRGNALRAGGGDHGGRLEHRGPIGHTMRGPHGGIMVDPLNRSIYNGRK